MIFYVVELLNDWNVDVPSWKYSRKLELPRGSSPGYGNDSKMMACQMCSTYRNSLSPEINLMHALWTPQQWSCVMFSDESRFSLQSDSRRTLIRKAPGTYYHQENTIERHRNGGAGWLV
ncbi:transposable element Tcb1 transposase [Trichonephila clavipes]|nr:transposable element Tcb1 transposase [Trichonephila clavipes]